MASQTSRTSFARYPENIVEQPRESAVIAQVYPLTFSDSNHDGVGDFRGVIKKLPYLRSIADTIWLSPFYPSPDGPAGDNGYACTDTRSVDPKFGTIRDLRQLVDKAHDLGMKVIFDFVPCHTSDQHPDFIKSAARIEPYDKYYVWHPGRKNPDGGRPLPPNNWLNVFDQSAWCWHEKRGEYYLNKFLNRVQPALDNNNPDVQQKNIDDMKFWLTTVRHDGFRLDAVDYATHMPLAGLGNDVDTKSNHSWRQGEWPHCWQSFQNQYIDKMACRPETVGFLRNTHTQLNAFAHEIGLPKPFVLAEAIAGRDGGYNSLPVASMYRRDVDSCYTTETLFFGYPNADRFRNAIERIETYLPGGKSCHVIGNHDFPRFESRIGDVPFEARRQLRKMMYCLPGDISFMAGAEELGLKQGNVPDAMRKDWGGRDACRTPAAWKMAADHLGFTRSETPYLPASAEQFTKAVDHQEHDPFSTLNYYRMLGRWRHAQPSITKGLTIVIDNPGSSVVAFLRISKDQTLLCTGNMSGQEARFTPSDYMDKRILEKIGLRPGQTIEFEGWGSEFFGAKPCGLHHDYSTVRQETTTSHHTVVKHHPAPQPVVVASRNRPVAAFSASAGD